MPRVKGRKIGMLYADEERLMKEIGRLRKNKIDYYDIAQQVGGQYTPQYLCTKYNRYLKGEK